MLNERSPLRVVPPRETTKCVEGTEVGVSSGNVTMRPVGRRLRSSNIALVLGATLLLYVLYCPTKKMLNNDSSNNGIILENADGALGKRNQGHFLLGHRKKKAQQTLQTPTKVYHFEPVKRCSWVKDRFNEKDADKTPQELATTYAVQGVDANVFYRATAHLFWQDFRDNQWDTVLLPMLKDYITDSTRRNSIGMIPLSALTPKSTWTWVTGDQHLSNFGAWRNRHGAIVFGVNDFDEAAIFDFQVDVLRIAVSVCGHAATTGLSPENVLRAIHTLTDSYVETVLGYIGNDKAALFELTPDTTHGKLREFLVKVRDSNSAKKQLKRFTQINASTGERSLIKGPIDDPDVDTGLQAIPAIYEEQLRNQFTATKYGATLLQVGWNVHPWDDTFFTILDAARRVGVGIGSYGVRRGFVLLKGTDGLLVGGGDGGDDSDGTAVILDVKYQPNGAVSNVLTPVERAWYEVMFQNNSAKRVTAGQLHLTSYTDPFIGWLMIEDRHNHTNANHTISNEPRMLSFSVRQRSPWKDSFDIDGQLTNPKDFLDFVHQIAVSTATSHVRGTVAKPPGDFKHVIATLFGSKKHRRLWGDAVAELAIAYHEQVLLDFECFQEVFMNHSATDI